MESSINDLSSPEISIGVDTGGTHTDLVLAGRGKLFTLKVPSTTDDLSVGIVEGVRKLVEMANVAVSDVDRFVYASTFVTNLFIEGKQAQVGLITTEGFKDVLEIGRASRKPDVYDIHWRPSPPLVPRHLRKGVIERIDHRGDVLKPLDEKSVFEALSALVSHGVESLAVCLLHSYVNPEHEQRIAAIAARDFPELDVSLSSDVVREFREYERTSTTSVNASIKSPISIHLKSLESALCEIGLRVRPSIMQGNGGICRFDNASSAPVEVTHSGVMGGIVGATALASQIGSPNIITLDMGGTSADVSLIANGRPTLSHRTSVGPYPLLTPTLDMVTIGAGGGSIAWIEGKTSLRVGPQSAGSVPGPACYGKGGVQPTVTDANLVAGRLNGGYFLKGARKLNIEAARTAIESVAKPLGLSVEQAALGIIAIAEAHMADAIRLISVERGLDPRDFKLVAFGGAGALHAVRLAEELAINQVVIPPAPGNLSAMGLLCANTRHDHAQTFFTELSGSVEESLTITIARLIEEGARSLAADGIEAGAQRFEPFIDLRYQGQNYELSLPLGKGTGANRIEALKAGFEAEHLKVYGYKLGNRPIQIVNVRVSAISIITPAEWPVLPAATKPAAIARPVDKRAVLISPDKVQDVDVYRHEQMMATETFTGPAIVEYSGSTLFVPPGWAGTVDSRANLMLSRD
ncbi:hydantoinase/oxoprolinase family protein [Paraburkholderia sp. J8-2]|uniref:hydantoinase/oxoprolinase family protein n=1 Tax=Paraburkholderia sp. J8-2 TaxID=2805440 RepID=UPI002AB76D50|nr:hydantoinase/oxoprolinase family protein [Paraburkholderia sp. J8-2]